MWTVGADITREEYLHLLDTAKGSNDERAYLLVKVMATTGVSIMGLPELTVEAVQAGELKVEHDVVPLAAGLRDELVAYAAWKSVHSGPVFTTRSGRPYNATQVSRFLHNLCSSAELDEEKCRPSALRKLYRTTKADAEARAADMLEQLMDRQANADAQAADMVEQLMDRQADAEARAPDMVEQLMDRQANADAQAADVAEQIVVRHTDEERLPIIPKRRERPRPAQKTAGTKVTTEKSSAPRPASDDPGVRMTQEDIEGYMAGLEAKGRISAPQQYSGILKQFYNDLPEDKRIRRSTLARWVELLQEKGYAPNTINSFAIVANGFLDYIGHREYQLSDLPKQEDNPQPELTRNEYLQLLQTAKRLDKEREYLLVKLFASCDLPVQQLDKVTVEAARAGCLTVNSSGTRSMVHLPGCLCRELLAYAGRQYIGVGPIFLSIQNRPMCRASIVQSITRLGEEAGLPSEKCNPQCLRRLYKTTRAAVEASFAVLVEQTMDRQAEQEQLIAGWEV